MSVMVVALVLAILLSAVFGGGIGRVLAGRQPCAGSGGRGLPGAEALAGLRARPDRVLVLFRLGDAFSDVSAGALTALLVLVHWHVVGVGAAIGVVSFLVLFFGELVPMGFAANRGVGVALAIARCSSSLRASRRRS